MELVFLSNDDILEEMNGPDKPWDYLHNRSYLLPEMKKIEA
jgi:hypothetical protein